MAISQWILLGINELFSWRWKRKFGGGEYDCLSRQGIDHILWWSQTHNPLHLASEVSCTYPLSNLFEALITLVWKNSTNLGMFPFKFLEFKPSLKKSFFEFGSIRLTSTMSDLFFSSFLSQGLLSRRLTRNLLFSDCSWPWTPGPSHFPEAGVTEVWLEESWAGNPVACY